MDNEQLKKHFGQQIRQYRKQNDFTIQELAEEVDISTNHLGRIELGISNTTITTLYRMAKVLNIPSHFHDEMKQYIPDSDE